MWRRWTGPTFQAGTRGRFPVQDRKRQLFGLGGRLTIEHEEAAMSATTRCDGRAYHRTDVPGRVRRPEGGRVGRRSALLSEELPELYRPLLFSWFTSSSRRGVAAFVMVRPNRARRHHRAGSRCQVLVETKCKTSRCGWQGVSACWSKRSFSLVARGLVVPVHNGATVTDATSRAVVLERR